MDWLEAVGRAFGALSRAKAAAAHAQATLAQLNIRARYDEEHVLAEVVESDPVVADLRERTRDLPAGTLHPDLVRLGERVSRAFETLRGRDREELLDAIGPLVVASVSWSGSRSTAVWYGP